MLLLDISDQSAMLYDTLCTVAMYRPMYTRERQEWAFGEITSPYAVL